MSWHIRHEGSPTTAAVTPQQVIQGLADGIWELTDEVRGPTEKNWTAVEQHPFFEEALADYEPPKKHHHDVEEHLDMNPLIDVALVLLIFFILTTSYDALRKVIEMPKMSQKGKKIVIPDEKQAQAQFCIVKVNVSDDGKTVTYEVDGKVVPEQHLVTAIKIAYGDNRKKMVIDPGNGVSWGIICEVRDAGKEALMDKVLIKAEQ